MSTNNTDIQYKSHRVLAGQAARKSTDKIRWAVCGLGRIQKTFLEALTMVDRAVVVACASSDIGRAKDFAKAHNIEYAYTYEELYKADGIDAVYVASNMNLHHDNTIGALRGGKAVLCEKSFCLTDTEALRMIETAKDSGTLLMEAMWTKFLPSTQRVLELTLSKELGDITDIHVPFEAHFGDQPNSRVFSKELGGGSILDLGVYAAAYAHMLLGVPRSMTVTGKVVDGVDHDCIYTLLYPTNVIAHLSSSLIRPYKATATINYTNGRIIVPEFFSAKAIEIHHANGTVDKQGFENIAGFVYQIQHFCELIKSGQKQSPIHSLSDTLEVMRILTQAQRQLGMLE